MGSFLLSVFVERTSKNIVSRSSFTKQIHGKTFTEEETAITEITWESKVTALGLDKVVVLESSSERSTDISLLIKLTSTTVRIVQRINGNLLYENAHRVLRFRR